MITLKTVKAISPVCDVKNSELFVSKWLIDNFGAVFVENKDCMKAKFG